MNAYKLATIANMIFFGVSALALDEHSNKTSSRIIVVDRSDPSFYYPPIDLDKLHPELRERWIIPLKVTQTWRSWDQLLIGGDDGKDTQILIDPFDTLNKVVAHLESLISKCHFITQYDGTALCEYSDELVDAASNALSQTKKYLSVAKHLSSALFQSIISAKSLEDDLNHPYEYVNVIENSDLSKSIFKDLEYLHKQQSELSESFGDLVELGLVMLGTIPIIYDPIHFNIFNTGKLVRTENDLWSAVKSYKLTRGWMYIDLGLNAVSCTQRKVRNPKASIFAWSEPAYIDDYNCTIEVIKI